VTKILLHEVGPRDGLQMEKATVPTEQKLSWLRAIKDSGLDIIQVGSFVREDKVPQMADTDELFRVLLSEPHRALLSALVLNERGLERGLTAGVEMFCMGASASETHSRENTGLGSRESQRRVIAMAKSATTAGKPVQVSIQSAFGCGFEGPITEDVVMSMVAIYLEAGLKNISLADTAGLAEPSQVERLFGLIFRMDSEVVCACHFHDTHGQGMANIRAARASGVTCFETSFGGLGGCPFTRNAKGNVATEDFVHALRAEGLREDIDLDGLVSVAMDVARYFGKE
jgi:hydroxymethylglutaryl-CoA lyase